MNSNDRRAWKRGHAAEGYGARRHFRQTDRARSARRLSPHARSFSRNVPRRLAVPQTAVRRGNAKDRCSEERRRAQSRCVTIRTRTWVARVPGQCTQRRCRRAHARDVAEPRDRQAQRRRRMVSTTRSDSRIWSARSCAPCSRWSRSRTRAPHSPRSTKIL